MKKGLSRRDFLKLAGTAAAGSVLAAYTPAPTAEKVLSAPPQQDAVSINMWGWTNLIDTAVVNKFMEKNPKIKVNLSEAGDMVFGDQKFLTALAAGKGPDVAVQNRHTFMQFAAKKLYKDISPLMQADGIKAEDFTPVQYAESSWDKKPFGLPMYTDVRYLYWNKAHFKEVGLDPAVPPKTWAELETFAGKLGKKNAKGEYDRYGFVPYLFGNSWMWLYGFLNKAPAISADKRTILCDDPKWAEALEWMVNFYDKNVGSFELSVSFSEAITSAGLGDPFVAGKVSMTASGNWQVGDFLRSPDFDWDCAPMPIPPNGEKSTWSCGWSIVMSPGTKQEKAAWELLKWHTTAADGWKARADAQVEDMKRTWEREKIKGEAKYWPVLACHVPSLTMLEKDYVSKLGDREKKAWALSTDALKNWTHGCGTEMGVAALEYWVEMDNAVRSALAKKKKPAEALAEAKKKVQEGTDRAWKAIDAAK